MSTATCQTTVGVFTSRDAAGAAISELHRSGFSELEIGLIHDNSKGTKKLRERKITAVKNDDDGAAAGGAVTGAVTGLGIGTLVGAGVLAGIVPVIGPALFAGTLGVLASNAGGGGCGGWSCRGADRLGTHRGRCGVPRERGDGWTIHCYGHIRPQ